MKNGILLFLLSFKLGYCQYLSSLNIQSNEIEGLYGTTEYEENIFESVADDEFGKNETIIELSDLHPNVLWNVHYEKEGEVIVKAEDGYKIVVAIIECSIKGSDSYVKISPKKDFSTKDTLLFVYEIKEQYTYLFNSNILFVEEHLQKADSKFTVNFTRIGEKAVQTTTSIPTTTIILPTPASNESSELTVYLGGMEPSQFKQLKVVTTLKEMLSNMATAYCKDQHFPLLENITIHNILISRLSPCPTHWRNADKCIELRFAIPVELNEDMPFKWTGYQLNSVHLKIMWERYSQNILEGLWVYDPPDINSSTKWEIIIAVLVIICFGVILVALKYILIVRPGKKQRKLSDTTSIISTNSRHSELSLRDHYLQEVPPIFHTTYTMYDPTKTPFVDPFDFSDLQTPTITDEKEEIASLSDLEESGA